MTVTDLGCSSTDQNDLFGQNGAEVNGHPVEDMDTDAVEKQEKPAAAKPALRMSFAEYKRVSNLLVLHMQKMEQREPWFYHDNNNVCPSFNTFLYVIFLYIYTFLKFYFNIKSNKIYFIYYKWVSYFNFFFFYII